jgi:hypothetical protein
MPLYNMVPKDKKSRRRPEVRRASVVIWVLPLILCFVASVIIWSYTVGQGRPTESETTAPLTESAPPSEDTAAEETAPDTPAESLPAESEAQPSDV